MRFYIQPPLPVELRERFRIGSQRWGFYGLDLVGQADWKSPEYKTLVGAMQRIITIKRGDWEERLLIGWVSPVPSRGCRQLDRSPDSWEQLCDRGESDYQQLEAGVDRGRALSAIAIASNVFLSVGARARLVSGGLSQARRTSTAEPTYMMMCGDRILRHCKTIRLVKLIETEIAAQLVTLANYKFAAFTMNDDLPI